MAARILLIGFYNEKALGVQYLSNTLKKAGYEPHILFFKEFNSVRPSKASERELELLEELIGTLKPSYIGLSVMSSLYLETVYMVDERIRSRFNIPMIWGGVYPTLFPEKALERCSYVIKGEGEYALPELLDALEKGRPVSGIEGLAYKDEKSGTIVNDMRPPVQNLNDIGFPDITDENRYFIRNDRMSKGGFALNSFVYELSASRGCPFACSYCSSVNLSRLYHGKGRYVRYRSVDGVISELKTAKANMKNLSAIHFWDEIFPDGEDWVKEFKEKYIKEIHLPFNIWGHPLRVRESVVADLVEAGLNQIVVGIQSGSPRVRKDVFNRPETQEQIIEASRILAGCRVPKVVYDFMLMHPFETGEDLMETYRLCLRLEHPFELQLHGLNFLPGTDITDMAVESGILSRKELEAIMYSPIQRQYDMYWGPAAANRVKAGGLWPSLIYLTQFAALRPLLEKIGASGAKGVTCAWITPLHLFMEKASRFNRLMHKARLALHFR